MRASPILCFLLVAGCASRGPEVGLPQTLRGLPWGDSPADRTVLRARSLFERGDSGEALRLVETVLAAHPRHVDAHRLRQDVLRSRGRRGLLLSENEAMRARRPDDALAWYLKGRLAMRVADKLESFGRAVELAPEALWGWLGLAYALQDRDPERSLEIFERLYGLSGGHPVVTNAYTAVLARRGDDDRLERLCREIDEDPPLAGLGSLRRAEGRLRAGGDEEPFPPLLRALTIRPYDPDVRRLVGHWLRVDAGAERARELFDALRRSPERLALFGRDDGLGPLCELLERHRQPAAAIARLRRAGVDARRPALRRRMRRLLLVVGDVAGFLAALREDLPRELIGAEPNRLRGRWLALLDGPWSRGAPLATRRRSAELVRALLATGLLVEAEQVAALALLRFPDDSAIAQARDEARRELAFEGGLRRLLYRGYREGNRAELEDVLGRLRALSGRVFGRDVVGRPKTFHLPFVGELVDSFDGPLAAHLSTYNRHLVLGRRAGGVVEGMLLTRLSLSELPPDPMLPLPGRCFRVVGQDRDVRALSGIVGGDIAGLALLNHFLIDYDAVREWAGTIAARREAATADGGALLRDPLPRDSGDDPVDVVYRLAALSSVKDSELESAVLEAIDPHERQHLVDSFFYFPFEWNVIRGLGLMLRFGLSTSAIQAEMERRAELASLARSPHTGLGLMHIADFLGEAPGDSPHHRGFQRLAAQIRERLEARGVPAERAVPARWHELDAALVRDVARELLGELP